MIITPMSPINIRVHSQENLMESKFSLFNSCYKSNALEMVPFDNSQPDSILEHESSVNLKRSASFDGDTSFSSGMLIQENDTKSKLKVQKQDNNRPINEMHKVLCESFSKDKNQVYSSTLPSEDLNSFSDSSESSNSEASFSAINNKHSTFSPLSSKQRSKPNLIIFDGVEQNSDKFSMIQYLYDQANLPINYVDSVDKYSEKELIDPAAKVKKYARGSCSGNHICKTSSPMEHQCYDGNSCKQVCQQCSGDDKIIQDCEAEPLFQEDEICKWLQEFNFQSKFIDTHCHIDFLFKQQNFKRSFKDYLRICEVSDPFPKSFEGCVAVFCDPLSFQKIEWWGEILANENVWGAFGCHPHFSNFFGPNEEEFLRFALKNEKVKALGEIGLDYSGRNENSKDLQEDVFRRQLKIALAVEKPLVIHSRDAYPSCFSILKEIIPKDYVIHRHCFTGSLEEAKALLEYFPNCYIGLTGLITHDSRRARNLKPVVEGLPLNRLLLETDAPYFKPRNLTSSGNASHPGMAIHVAYAISQIKKLHIEKVLYQTRENARAVYSI